LYPELKRTIDGLESEIKTLKAKLDTRAFLTAWVPDSKTMSKNGVIPFTIIKAMHGVRNVSTMTSRGVFTCEKTGYYFVSFFVTSKSPLILAPVTLAILYKNKYDILARATKRGGDDYETNAAMTITQLNKGDSLSVRARFDGMNVYNTYDSVFTILQIY
ncbi:hypothetical protein AM593_10281, partial [Mytilus galloprovincialis]